jgi:hypothetical protein
MKTRRVFSSPDPASAGDALAAARRAGAAEDDLSLIARADIELVAIPEGRQEAETDFKPALAKGAGVGGATGLLAGLAAAVIPPLGITVAGVAVMTAMGAAVGSWAAALMGSTIPDPVKRQFEDQIEAGRVLLVVDADPDQLAAIEAAVIATGAIRLPYDAPSIIS